MEGDTDDLLKPTTSVAVELGFAGKPPLPVNLAVPEPADVRPIKILDTLRTFLLQDRRFLPARDQGTGSWFLFHRHRLQWLRWRPEESLEKLDSEHRISITVELIDQSRIEGELLVDDPPASVRPLDYVNEAEELIPLYESDFLWLIHRDAILRIWDPKSW